MGDDSDEQEASGLTVNDADEGAKQVDLATVQNEVAQFELLKETLRQRRTMLLAEATRIGELLGDVVDVEEPLTRPVRRQVPQGIRTGLTSDLETYIGDHPGCSLNEIHEALGAEKVKITNMLVRLKREGRVRTSGERRSYTYSMVRSR